MFGFQSLLLLSLAVGADLQTLAGKKLSGELVGIDKQKITLKTSDGEQRIPVAEVLAIDLASAEPLPLDKPYFDIELTDGSVFHCPKVEIRGNTIEATALPDLALKIPLSAVYSLLRDAQDAKSRLEWQKFVTKRGRFDLLGVRGADGQLNAVEGTFGPGLEGGDGIEFMHQESGKKLSPKLAKAQGLVFIPRPIENSPQPICRATDLGRNTIVVAEVAQSADELVLTTVSGVKVKYAGSKSLAKLDFSKGKLTFLSDLEPAKAGNAELSTEDSPVLGQFLSYRKDRNLTNGPLRLDGTNYPRGLALHAGTQLVYEIAGDYKEFRTVVGVDESVQTDSPVEVVIEGDGRVLARETVSRKGKGKSLTLDVKGVQQLRITVASKELLELGGQAILADAKVSK